MAKIGVDLGMTLNLGNYQALKINVLFEDDVRDETNDEAFERVYQFVEEKLAAKVEEARTTLGVK